MSKCLYCYQELKENEMSPLILFSHKANDPISLDQVVKSTEDCIKLSDSISKCLAIFAMEKQHFGQITAN